MFFFDYLSPTIQTHLLFSLKVNWSHGFVLLPVSLRRSLDETMQMNNPLNTFVPMHLKNHLMKPFSFFQNVVFALRVLSSEMGFAQIYGPPKSLAL